MRKKDSFFYVFRSRETLFSSIRFSTPYWIEAMSLNSGIAVLFAIAAKLLSYLTYFKLTLPYHVQILTVPNNI